MCGLAIAVPKPGKSFGADVIQRALKQMRRRGPDAEGIWEDRGVLLGHRRLAIQDLDERATQPLHSACGRFVVVFNGEIYNFRALSAELIAKGIQLHTTSDSEVLLALFSLEGASMLPRLRGMFAFVIWDRTTRRAFAARDPYGIKPLYYAQTTEGVLMASQVRALLETGLVSRAPCAQGQAGFWLLGSVREPDTWYQGVKALPAGHHVWIEEGRMDVPQSWWDVSAAWRDAPSHLLDVREVRERTRTALSASVRAHLVSDVPIGVFLSGGIDSGALAGLMVEAGVKDLQGITLAYDEFSGTPNDEAPVAASLAAHYGIKHHVRRVTREEFETDLPRILADMDQPSVDGINTWYASKAVAELGLKVVVSGVGGDELFQGYSSFAQLPRMLSGWAMASRLPFALPLARAATSWQAKRSGNARWHHLPEWARTMAGAWWLRRGLYAPAELAALMGPDLAAEGLAGFSPDAWVGAMSGALVADSRLAVGQIESTTYLRNQLLRDSDWASMAHSVELRTPLVDASLLQDLQPLLGAFQQFPNKRLLATAAERPLPENIIKRPKTGFGIPVQTWLKQIGKATVRGGPSHAWALEVARVYDEVSS
jgi:asparagine synthase (glutamine-hydrolysing)